MLLIHSRVSFYLHSGTCVLYEQLWWHSATTWAEWALHYTTKPKTTMQLGHGQQLTQQVKQEFKAYQLPSRPQDYFPDLN